MLKKIAFAALGSLGVLALAGAAQANSSDNFVLQAVVAPVCMVTAPASTFNVDLTTSTSQYAGDLTYKCNALHGFSVDISSANGGQLVNGSQRISWLGQQGGSRGLDAGPAQLTSPLHLDIPLNSDFLGGVPAPIHISVPSAPTNLYSGTYSDVVTVVVTAKP